PDYDRLYLPALNVDIDFDSFSLVSNTSYLYNSDKAYPDYSVFLHYLLTGNPYPTSDTQWSQGNFLDTQRFFTQELRLQSAANASLRWVVGVFYQRNTQLDEELVSMPNLPEIFFAAHGVSYVSVFGTPLGPDYSVYTDIENIHDDQLAGYGQVDYQILRKLTLTAGARVAR